MFRYPFSALEERGDTGAWRATSVSIRAHNGLQPLASAGRRCPNCRDRGGVRTRIGNLERAADSQLSYTVISCGMIMPCPDCLTHAVARSTRCC